MIEERVKVLSDEYELIAFRVGQQEFCIDIMMVREVRGWSVATELPRTPSYVKGVINLRGAVLPIIDLALCLGMPSADPTARSVIIVVQLANRQIGILVDAVSDILTTDRNLIQPVPDVTSGLMKSFVRGLLTMDGRMISLITLSHILQVEDMEGV